MGKLYFHCGIFHDKFNKKIEVLGSLTATGLETSTIGRELRAPAEGERHVFSNNDNLFNGMRVALHKGQLNVDDVVVYFNHEVDGNLQTTIVEFNQSGRAQYWPKGFFDQYDNDLSALLGWDEIVQP